MLHLTYNYDAQALLNSKIREPLPNFFLKKAYHDNDLELDQNNVLQLGLGDWQTKKTSKENTEDSPSLHFSRFLPCVFCLTFSANIIVPSLL